MSVERDGQPVLPLEVREKREVWWILVEEQKQRRKWLVGQKTVENFMIGSNGMPKVHKLDTDDISQLRDPNLAYALRLQDAVAAVGWDEYAPGQSSGHYVAVHATDEGLDSRLTSVIYSGHSGDIEEDLHIRGNPQYAKIHRDHVDG